MGSEVDLLSGGELLNIVLVVFELNALAEENVAVGRAVAGHVLEGTGNIAGKSGDGLRSTDLLRDRTCLTNRRRDYVAVRKRGGGEKG